MNIFLKIWTWVTMNIATIVGVAQAAVKILKEIITGVLNLVSLLFPTTAIEKFIIKVRDLINKLDEWLEKIKPYLIPKVA